MIRSGGLGEMKCLNGIARERRYRRQPAQKKRNLIPQNFFPAMLSFLQLHTTFLPHAHTLSVSSQTTILAVKQEIVSIVP